MTNPGRRERILLVEDQGADARLVFEYLKRGTEPIDAELVHVGDLHAAFEAVRREPIDVILLDLNLPDSRGFQTLERMFKEAPAAPIIVFSVIEDTETILRAVRSGARDYLVKSRLTAESLCEAVGRQLAWRRAVATTPN